MNVHLRLSSQVDSLHVKHMKAIVKASLCAQRIEGSVGVCERRRFRRVQLLWHRACPVRSGHLPRIQCTHHATDAGTLREGTQPTARKDSS